MNITTERQLKMPGLIMTKSLDIQCWIFQPEYCTHFSWTSYILFGNNRKHKSLPKEVKPHGRI